MPQLMNVQTPNGAESVGFKIRWTENVTEKNVLFNVIITQLQSPVPLSNL